MVKKTTKMSETEKKQWDELYQYVKKEILQYEIAQSIPSSLVLRLRGLASGKFMENSNIENKAQYTYEIILFTFQICKPTILNAIRTKDFKSETFKFNYICKIVENNINDVFIRVNNAKKTQEKTNKINTDNLLHSGATYQTKSENTKNSKLNELW